MTAKFVATAGNVGPDELALAVNAAVAPGRPLLVKGAPGTGKTNLTASWRHVLVVELIGWHVKSTNRAAQGLYNYDAVVRLRAGPLDEVPGHDDANHSRPGPL